MENKIIQDRFLHCNVENVNIAIDIQYIHKVISLPFVEPVPQAPGFVAGVFSLGGKNITVIDLALLLGLDRFDSYTVDTPVVICAYQGNQLALIVNETTQIYEANTNEVEMKQEFEDKNSAFVGVITTGDHISLLLDIPRTFKKCHSLQIDESAFDHTFITDLVIKNE